MRISEALRHVAYRRGVARRNVAYQKRVIDFAGLAEIRSDEGIMLLRVPVNGAVMVEEARSLIDGARDARQSGYLHTDIRGSTLARVDWSEQMSLPFEEAEYGAWGETLRVSELDAPTHQFVGFEPDPATGWYFMGARVYDPALRRWLSPDPLLLAAPEVDVNHGASLNLYGYADNNPVGLIDPEGTKPFAQTVGSGSCGRQWDCTSESNEWARQTQFDKQLKNFGQVFGVFGDIGDVITGLFYVLAVVENPTSDNVKDFGVHAVWGAVPIVGAGVAKGLLKEPVRQAGKGTVEAVKQQAKKGIGQPKLPILDSTKKVHGELPSPQKLGDYPHDALIQLRDELKESVKTRIEKNIDYGYDRPHGQRQAAEQDLIKSINNYLED